MFQKWFVLLRVFERTIDRTNRQHLVVIRTASAFSVSFNKSTGQIARHSVEPIKLTNAVALLVVFLRPAVEPQHDR